MADLGDHRCEIELIDPSADVPGLLVVRKLRINGTAVYMPTGTQITITAGDHQATTVSLKLLPTKILITSERAGGDE